MNRRCLLLFGLFAAHLVLGVGGWVSWPRTSITRENALRIELGMTRTEVESFLGGPARNETRGAVRGDCIRVKFAGRDENDFPKVWVHEEWTSYECGVWAEFTEDEGRVFDLWVGDVTVLGAFTQRIRHWLRL